MTRPSPERLGLEFCPLWVTIQYLAGGVSIADMPRLVSSRVYRDDTSFTAADVRATLSEAARLVERWQLSAPAAAAYVERHHAARAVVDLEGMRSLAVAQFDQLAEGSNPDEEQPPRMADAASYAIAVVAERDHRRAWRSAVREDDLLRRTITKSEDERLADLFLSRARGLMPGRLFGDWSRLVELLEADRRLEATEYQNWLDGRDLLEDAIMLVEPPGATAARGQLELLDARFRAATRAASGDPLGLDRRPWRLLRWWWRRVPTNFVQ